MAKTLTIIALALTVAREAILLMLVIRDWIKQNRCS